jgi:hypothetical protein
MFASFSFHDLVSRFHGTTAFFPLPHRFLRERGESRLGAKSRIPHEGNLLWGIFLQGNMVYLAEKDSNFRRSLLPVITA